LPERVNKTMNTKGTDAFFTELRAAIDNAEALLHSAAEGADDAREAARDKLREARERMGQVEEDLLSGARAKARVADSYVRDNPWQAIGVVAGVAFVIGVLLGRRR
jgi:ElaB/YqjD/DUF883 family membrane-anchored ribosome-binding protein